MSVQCVHLETAHRPKRPRCYPQTTMVLSPNDHGALDDHGLESTRALDGVASDARAQMQA